MAAGSHPVASSLRGACIIEPATQGDYDGLCALYCIVNAIRLVMAPHRELTREEGRALFRAGVRFLERQSALTEATLYCVNEWVWPKLAKRLVAKAQEAAERPIVFEHAPLSEDAPIHRTLHRIEGMIASGKAPCVFLRGRTRHYTVISGYTPLSLKLFDSFGYHWVLRRSCGTQTPRSVHRFHVQSILTVAAP